MLLTRITLNNFGIYKGQHTVDLSTNYMRPIILFGALNGGGKTTFLDALQLVLYGKHAKCSNRGSLSYGAFLTSARNRYTSQEESSSITLEFSHTVDTDEKHFTVHRSWGVASSVENTRDKVVVSCNGVEDLHLSLHWDDFVSEFIPLSLSDLFFFDGEKIENLAHPERSAELIKTGIENLLGLDLLSQLHIDLGNIEKSRKTENLDKNIIHKVEECEEEIGEINSIISQYKKDMAECEQNASDLNIRINKTRQQTRNSGAHLIEQRDSIQFELGAIRQQLKSNQVQRVKLDSGYGPLALIQPLIDAAKKQVQLEEEIQQAKTLDKAIQSYEETLLNTLNQASMDATAHQTVTAAMNRMAEQRRQATIQECYLGLSPSIFSGLEDKLTEDKIERKRLMSEREQLLEQESLFEKKEQSIPDYDAVKHILVELATLENEFAICIQQKEHLQQQLDQSIAKQAVLNQRYTQLLTQQNKDTFEQKRSIQVVEHIHKLKETMSSFAKGLIRENIELLENKITEKFITLSRKEKLVKKVVIHPTSFSISLYTEEGGELSPSRLSAGERQLLAVAIMWGLADASGKELPTVIDTPLGRLDGKHRSRLIENYFPYASQQVILLSTDEEISGQYHDALMPFVSRQYHIQYNETEQTSTIEEGYF